jgi:hypothetical protein
MTHEEQHGYGRVELENEAATEAWARPETLLHGKTALRERPPCNFGEAACKPRASAVDFHYLRVDLEKPGRKGKVSEVEFRHSAVEQQYS